MKVFWLLLLFSISCFGAVDLPQAAIDKIMELTTPLENDVTYYHWTSKEYADDLIKYKSIHPSIISRYDEYGSRRLAHGLGVYIAGNPFSSSSYANTKRGAGLVEVRIPKGTPLLNTHDPVKKTELILLLKQFDLDYENDFKNAFNLPLLQKTKNFTEWGDWFVIKDPTISKFNKTTIFNKNTKNYVFFARKFHNFRRNSIPFLKENIDVNYLKKIIINNFIWDEVALSNFLVIDDIKKVFEEATLKLLDNPTKSTLENLKNLLSLSNDSSGNKTVALEVINKYKNIPEDVLQILNHSFCGNELEFTIISKINKQYPLSNFNIIKNNYLTIQALGNGTYIELKPIDFKKVHNMLRQNPNLYGTAAFNQFIANNFDQFKKSSSFTFQDFPHRFNNEFFSSEEVFDYVKENINKLYINNASSYELGQLVKTKKLSDNQVKKLVHLYIENNGKNSLFLTIQTRLASNHQLGRLERLEQFFLNYLFEVVDSTTSLKRILELPVEPNKIKTALLENSYHLRSIISDDLPDEIKNLIEVHTPLSTFTDCNSLFLK
jgi:hypothetical protein